MGQGAYDADESAAVREAKFEYEDTVRELNRQSAIDAMKAQYSANRLAAIGTEMACPTCEQKTIKTTYRKVFCSNQKTTGKHESSCKDRYWNVVDEKRRVRAMKYLDDQM